MSASTSSQFYEAGLAKGTIGGAATTMAVNGATASTVIISNGNTADFIGNTATAFTAQTGVVSGVVQVSSTSASTVQIFSVSSDSSTFAILEYSTINGVTTSTAVVSFTGIGSVQSYNSTTLTSAVSSAVNATETSTRLSVFLTGTTISASTSTTGGTTTSTTVNTVTTASSADTFTTSVASTVTVTVTSYGTSWKGAPAVYDTIVLADWTDWLWQITTTGTGHITAIGASFTRSTFKPSWTAGSQFAATFNATATSPSVIFSFTSTTYTTSTISSSYSTTSLSTYAVGIMPTTTVTTTGAVTSTTATMAAATPLSMTSEASITYTTSGNTTYTYQVSALSVVNDGSVLSTAGFTRASSFTDTVTTTFTGGTSLSFLTYTLPELVDAYFTGSESTSASRTGRTTRTNGTTASTGTLNGTEQTGITVASATVSYYTVNNVVNGGGAPAFLDFTIGAGWQATPANFGRQQPAGTNIVGVPLKKQDLGWPALSVPEVASTDSPAIAGVVPTSLQNIYVTSPAGGFGWNTTADTTFTFAPGIYRLTTCDSFSNTSSFETTFGTSNSTYTLSQGEGLAAETVPQCWSDNTDTLADPYIQFPAFPFS